MATKGEQTRERYERLRGKMVMMEKGAENEEFGVMEVIAGD